MVQGISDGHQQLHAGAERDLDGGRGPGRGVETCWCRFKGPGGAGANTGGLSQDEIDCPISCRWIRRSASITRYQQLDELRGPQAPGRLVGLHHQRCAGLGAARRADRQRGLRHGGDDPGGRQRGAVGADGGAAFSRRRRSPVRFAGNLREPGRAGTVRSRRHKKRSAIAFAINQISDSTGVAAGIASATNASSGITFSSTGYGSKEFVSVQVWADPSAFVHQQTTPALIQQRAVRTRRDRLHQRHPGDRGRPVPDPQHGQLSLSDEPGRGLRHGHQELHDHRGRGDVSLGAQLQSNQQVSIAIGSGVGSRLATRPTLP